MTTFELSIILKAAGAVLKIGSSQKPNHHLPFQLAQICETLCRLSYWCIFLPPIFLQDFFFLFKVFFSCLLFIVISFNLFSFSPLPLVNTIIHSFKLIEVEHATFHWFCNRSGSGNVRPAGHMRPAEHLKVVCKHF